MKRIVAPFVLGAALLFAGCPRDRAAEQPGMVLDTTPVDLDTILTTLPPPAADTAPEPVRGQPATREPRTAVRNVVSPAPRELLDAVSREQAMSRFCYEEFGQKDDPTLAGEVALVVTVNQQGVATVNVGDDTWSGRAGRSVNRCLSERAPQAWTVAPGAVRPGRYQVNLRFRPT